MNIALLVGINKYYTSGNDLKGCVNDVENMKEFLLNHCGFSLMQIKTLTDKQATESNIIKSLKQMVEQAKQGDHLIFHFSGHGSQVPDNGFFSQEEADGLDEVLCPYDFDFGGIFIRDDKLRKIVDELNPEATLDVILDCCHSGTGLKDVGTGTSKYISNFGVVMEEEGLYPFPLDWQARIDAVLPENIGGILKVDVPSNVALWAGCKDHETSADTIINGIPQGAMTWAFTMSYPNKFISRSELIEGIKTLLVENGYQQTPQLECVDSMKEAKVFC